MQPVDWGPRFEGHYHKTLVIRDGMNGRTESGVHNYIACGPWATTRDGIDGMNGNTLCNQPTDRASIIEGHTWCSSTSFRDWHNWKNDRLKTDDLKWLCDVEKKKKPLTKALIQCREGRTFARFKKKKKTHSQSTVDRLKFSLSERVFKKVGCLLCCSSVHVVYTIKFFGLSSV